MRVFTCVPVRAVAAALQLMKWNTCSMNEPSLVARYFHSCSKPTVAIANSTPGVFCIARVTLRSSSTFSSSGTGHGILLDRHLPELVVRRHRREPHVALLRDRAGARDVGGDAGDALDFLGRHERAAGEAPDAAVDHADAEAVGLDGAAAAAPPNRRRRIAAAGEIWPLRTSATAIGCA